MSTDLDRVLSNAILHFLNFEEMKLMSCVRHIWAKEWKLQNAAYFEDEPKLNQAIRASLIEALVDVWRKKGDNSVFAPGWCQTVPGLEQTIYAIKPNLRSLFESDLKNPFFAKRNIDAPSDFLFFI